MTDFSTLASLTFIIGILLTAWAGFTMLQARKNRWHHVKTKLARTDVQADTTTGNYNASLFYTYIVDARKYSGKHQLERLGKSEIEAHQSLRTHFPKDRELIIYYNPEKPEENTLSAPELSSLVRLGGAIGILCIVVSVGLTLFNQA